MLSVAVIFCIKWFKNKKNAYKQAITISNDNLIRFKLSIQTMSNLKLTSLIKKLIPASYSPKISKEDITFTKNNETHVFSLYYSSQLDESKLLEIIKTKKTNNLVVFCSNKDAKLISTAFKDKKIELINIEQLYEIFNTKNIQIPTDNIDLNKSKVSLNEVLKNSLSRNKSKGYFISGLVLLFTSLIIPYKIYYVVFSSVLFLLSLLCRIKPIQKTNYSIFD